MPLTISHQLDSIKHVQHLKPFHNSLVPTTRETAKCVTGLCRYVSSKEKAVSAIRAAQQTGACNNSRSQVVFTYCKYASQVDSLGLAHSTNPTFCLPLFFSPCLCSGGMAQADTNFLAASMSSASLGPVCFSEGRAMQACTTQTCWHILVTCPSLCLLCHEDNTMRYLPALL